MFWLRRQIKEPRASCWPRWKTAKPNSGRRYSAQATGLRAVLADRWIPIWLIGASLAWLLFDFVYYGNTIALPIVVAWSRRRHS